jgi:hypothetical protein
MQPSAAIGECSKNEASIAPSTHWIAKIFAESPPHPQPNRTTFDNLCQAGNTQFMIDQSPQSMKGNVWRQAQTCNLSRTMLYVNIT